jgi:ABC-type amino acid transport substrate-binding protein
MIDRHHRVPRRPLSQRTRRRFALAAVQALLVASLAGCGAAVPSDPDGTIDSVRHGELRVGVVPDEGLASVTSGEPSGPLPQLAQEFAATLDAEVEWTVGGEETLVRRLEDGDVDLVVGGFTEQTPWVDRAGVTRAFTGVEGSDGRSLVMLVPLGENAFLTQLETFLDQKIGS